MTKEKVKEVIEMALERDGIILRYKGYIKMAKVIKKSEHPMKDEGKTAMYTRISEECLGWKNWFSRYWCPRNGYPYGLEIVSHEIDVDDDKYIAVAFVKRSSMKEVALTDFGFVEL